VHLDGRLLDTILGEEVGDLGTLVALELDNLAHLLVVNKSAVAGEFLKCFTDQIFLPEEPDKESGEINCKENIPS